MRYFMLTTLLMTMTGFAKPIVLFNPYQQTTVEITNQTPYVEWVKIDDYQGVWKKSVVNNQFFELAPSQTYQNTLQSLAEAGAYQNFASFAIARKDGASENYLIFAESTDEHYRRISADIFDGLGDMFVSSWTNECKDKGDDGYAVCRLVVFDKS